MKIRYIAGTVFLFFELFATLAHATLTETVLCSSTGTVITGTKECADPNGNAHATASASYGVLKSYADASGVLRYSSGAASTTAWADTLTIYSTGLLGQRGTMSFSEVLGGVLSVAQSTFGVSSASVSFTFEVLGAAESAVVYLRYHEVERLIDSFGSLYQESFLAYDKGDPVPFSNTINGSFDFIYGQTMTFRATLQANATEQLSGQAIVDFAHSSSWNGITGVTYQGQPVDFTVISESGTDWRNSFLAPSVNIPEPCSISIFAVGLYALITSRRRKKRG